MLAGINSTLGITEENIRQLENTALEIIQLSAQRKKNEKKVNKHQSPVKQGQGALHICNQSFRKEGKQKKYSKKKMAETFPDLMEIQQVQETQ